MIDFSLMLSVKLPVVDRIQPQSDKFAMGEDNKATGVSKLNDSPGIMNSCLYQIEKYKTVTCSLRFPSICIHIIFSARKSLP